MGRERGTFGTPATILHMRLLRVAHRERKKESKREGDREREKERMRNSESERE